MSVFYWLSYSPDVRHVLIIPDDSRCLFLSSVHLVTFWAVLIECWIILMGLIAQNLSTAIAGQKESCNAALSSQLMSWASPGERKRPLSPLHMSIACALSSWNSDCKAPQCEWSQSLQGANVLHTKRQNQCWWPCFLACHTAQQLLEAERKPIQEVAWAFFFCLVCTHAHGIRSNHCFVPRYHCASLFPILCNLWRVY